LTWESKNPEFRLSATAKKNRFARNPNRLAGSKIDEDILCSVFPLIFLAKVSERIQLRRPGFRGHDTRTPAVRMTTLTKRLNKLPAARRKKVEERAKALIAEEMSLQELRKCENSKR
jgi:hypothetical protein